MESILMQQQQPARSKRVDADCTDLESYGIHGRNTNIGHMFDTARHNVTIDHQAVDPYTDIVAVNAYTLINLRQVLRTTATKHGVQHQNSLTACTTGIGRSLCGEDPGRGAGATISP
jgi:hypothetical protein